MTDLRRKLMQWADEHHGFFPPFWGVHEPGYTMIWRELMKWAQLAPTPDDEAAPSSFDFSGVTILPISGSQVMIDYKRDYVE